MSKYTHDIVATVGEFTNRSGETKMKYPKPVLLGRAMFGQFADEEEMEGLTEI